MIRSQSVLIRGMVPRIAKLSAEYYEYIDAPDDFLTQLRDARVQADLFTFLQQTQVRDRLWQYHSEAEYISVLPISSFDAWFKKTLNDKTRNMIRRAGKKGVVISICTFSDELVAGIKSIYDESKIRQGKPFAHFGKDLDTLRRDHASYVERSDFICAHHDGELIGFLKLVHGAGISNIMQIVSKVAHRDKSPTNALIAKAVEICAAKSVPRLHYGLWSRGGLGDFKQHHGFEQVAVQRYFVPLNLFGMLCLRLGMHRKLSERLPEPVVERLVTLRGKWNAVRLGAQ